MSAMSKQSYRLLIVFGCMIAGSAAAQSVTSVYQSPPLSGSAYAKILVVGMHADAGRRRRFEDDAVSAFAAQGVGAVSTLATRGGDVQLNRDILVVAARDTGSDAVLITRLLEVQGRAEAQEDRAAVDGERRDDQPLAVFFRDEYPKYRDPMTVVTTRTVIVVSDLYDVASEKRVWSGQSTTFAKDDVDAAIEGVARAVTRTLRAGGWLD